eukprot:CAMPEP_0194047666 /NCGR_PEP_ID=MMETSP0009_2-20130614/25103_1 /TAXON_ID=210454 /ORGANISM="Grammatophora oceanica, Strain CCMP 410" /LENGTH=246 /DNA_ID=CAMNT_0038693339 /DNA_START=162 /DNA_END=902 /DNA_ORIENTATION=-
MANVHTSSHPVLRHKITILRSSETTSPGQFRSVLREVTYHLGYEATSTLHTKNVDITVPKITNSTLAADAVESYAHGDQLTDRVALIPILRSGLGMAESMLELLPNASVHHIGMYKNKVTGMPVQYYNRLPRKCLADVAYVLDPIIATSNTITSVVGILKKWGVPKIHVVSVIASQDGVQKLMEAHPDIHLTSGTVDERLSEDGSCFPGMGDMGDRLFNSLPAEDEDEEALVHPSKRKRTMSEAEP